MYNNMHSFIICSLFSDSVESYWRLAVLRHQHGTVAPVGSCGSAGAPPALTRTVSCTDTYLAHTMPNRFLVPVLITGMILTVCVVTFS
jgi:hypothetical protein